MERLKAIAIVEAIHDLRASLVDDGAIPSHADGLRMAQEAVAAGAITFADGDDGWASPR